MVKRQQADAAPSVVALPNSHQIEFAFRFGAQPLRQTVVLTCGSGYVGDLMGPLLNESSADLRVHLTDHADGKTTLVRWDYTLRREALLPRLNQALAESDKYRGVEEDPVAVASRFSYVSVGPEVQFLWNNQLGLDGPLSLRVSMNRWQAKNLARSIIAAGRRFYENVHWETSETSLLVIPVTQELVAEMAILHKCL
jgi:hypothetical protein